MSCKSLDYIRLALVGSGGSLEDSRSFLRVSSESVWCYVSRGRVRAVVSGQFGEATSQAIPLWVHLAALSKLHFFL